MGMCEYEVQKEIAVTKVETTPREQQRVLEALSLMFQANNIHHGNAWDCQSIDITDNEYGTFAYAVVNYSPPTISCVPSRMIGFLVYTLRMNSTKACAVFPIELCVGCRTFS